jgi:hypothetical protein
MVPEIINNLLWSCYRLLPDLESGNLDNLDLISCCLAREGSALGRRIPSVMSLNYDNRLRAAALPHDRGG